MSANLKEFTDTNFQNEVMGADKPVLVDFWAEWCGPCKALTPTIEKLAGEFEGRVDVGKMDIQKNPQTPGHFRVMSIPTLFFFKGGQVVDQLVGKASEDQIREKLEGLAG